MRTTITLDADVAELVAEAMHRERASMKQIVNDALRSALGTAPASGEVYRTPVHRSRVRPEITGANLNRLADELDDAALVERRQRG
ncbi:hypothetical protein [Tsukamurella pseudospumae]|uniref:Antitoxin n=1 Tax=Tsukamurella pseudospumae TaxID=239498 RepID=A0A138AJ92_9ACTN|nr:hypothetical protein [Tsukamurella pseudospumae]KXO98787.1 hypothetical protein AXK61_02740 [Tsukamurella pseudospumae]KXP10462.1 hypothetical protein AXK60_06645 [Tsukamurella pseudospumae]